MRLREKGKKGGEPIGMGWDEAQAALQAGTHEVAEGEGDPGTITQEASQAAADENDGLDQMTRAELDAIALERNIDVTGAANKADVIKALRGK